MQIWDDPLAQFSKDNTTQSADIPPHAGDGLVGNDALMKTAGAAPSVDPNPVTAEQVAHSVNAYADAPVPQTTDIEDDSDLSGTGLEQLEMGAARIQVDDKKIINCQADVNQLVPFKYNWAWEKYLSACNNHWMPQEISMAADIALWSDPNGLTDDERTYIVQSAPHYVAIAANYLAEV